MFRTSKLIDVVKLGGKDGRHLQTILMRFRLYMDEIISSSSISFEKSSCKFCRLVSPPRSRMLSMYEF